MNALIVAPTEKSFISIEQTLRLCGNYSIMKATNLAEARKALFSRDFSLAIVYEDMNDIVWREYVEGLASRGIGTVCLPPKGVEDSAAALCDSGVQVVTSPVTKATLYLAMRTAIGVSMQCERLFRENAKLREKLAAQKDICKAKCYLVAEGNTEEEAHKVLERRAMQERRTIQEIAADIIHKAGEKETEET